MPDCRLANIEACIIDRLPGSATAPKHVYLLAGCFTITILGVADCSFLTLAPQMAEADGGRLAQSSSC